MPRFKVVRHKRYETEIEASSLRLATIIAEEVPGNKWQLVEDTIEKVGDAAEPDSEERCHRHHRRRCPVCAVASGNDRLGRV